MSFRTRVGGSSVLGFSAWSKGPKGLHELALQGKHDVIITLK